jgi:hypothetical protein
MMTADYLDWMAAKYSCRQKVFTLKQGLEAKKQLFGPVQ